MFIIRASSRIRGRSELPEAEVGGVAHLRRPREQTTTKMTAPAEDDGALDGHLEREARAANQANPRYSAQIARSHARLGNTATATLCAKVGG
jgi:hypothetical protein